MSDEQQQSEDTAAKPPETKVKASPKTAPKRSRASKLFGVLMLLLVLAAIAGAGYNYWLLFNMQSQQQQAGESRQAMQSLLVANQQALKQQQLVNGTLREQLHKVEAQQLSLYDANMELKRRLQELSHTDRSDWQLAEVEYMLRLAHQRVVSNNNAKLGLELLLSADELIRELDAADLFGIRKQIASDAAALRNAVDVDVEGLYLALGALANSAGDIQFNQSDLKPADTASVAEATGLKRAWQQLASLYRVTLREDAVQPLFSHAQQQSLRQQLLLLIGQSRQALLTASSSLYVASLAEAKDIAQRYAIDDESLKTFIHQIDSFAATPIVPQLPDISGSHAKMRAYIDSKRERGLVPVDTAAADSEAP